MDKIEKIRAEIKRRITLYSSLSEDTVNPNRIDEDKQLLSFLNTLSEEPEEESSLQDAEVVFSGHALHTDVTKWADGYKLKIRIYDDN